MIDRLYLFQTTITGISMNKLNVPTPHRDKPELTVDQINELLYEAGHSPSTYDVEVERNVRIHFLSHRKKFLLGLDDEYEEEEEEEEEDFLTHQVPTDF